MSQTVEQSLLDVAREFLEMVSGELDPYTSDKGIIKTEGMNKVVLLTPYHIQFAKYGRGPGKQPPHQVILDWVKEENIKFDGSDYEGTAWAIAKSIGKKGTLNWKPNAPNAMDEAITKHLDEYNKKAANMLALTVHDQMQETYRKLYPQNITYKA